MGMVTERSQQCALALGDTAFGLVVWFYFCLAWVLALRSRVRICRFCARTRVHLHPIQGLLLILAWSLLPEPWLSSLAWTVEPILGVSESLFWSI